MARSPGLGWMQPSLNNSWIRSGQEDGYVHIHIYPDLAAGALFRSKPLSKQQHRAKCANPICPEQQAFGFCALRCAHEKNLILGIENPCATMCSKRSSPIILTGG